MELNKKLIFNTPEGTQEVRLIGPGGGCNDKSFEVWNEDVDGPVDPDCLKQVGGLVRKGKEIFYDKSRLEKHKEAISTIESVADALLKEKEARVTMIQNVSSAKTLEDLQAIISAIGVELGYPPAAFFDVKFHLPYLPPKRLKFLWLCLAASLLVSVGVNLIFKFALK